MIEHRLRFRVFKSRLPALWDLRPRVVARNPLWGCYDSLPEEASFCFSILGNIVIRSTSISLPVPDSWQDFELLIAQLFENEYGVEVHRHGRSGQSDDGVDIYFEDDDGDFVGIQCKLTNELSKQTILKEIGNARSFEPELSNYLIVSSAPQDSNLQEEFRLIVEEGDHPFNVDLFMWDDIGRLLARNEVVFKQFYGDYIETPAIDLADYGIVRLTENHFNEETVRLPETAWQSELTFAEIAAGYAFQKYLGNGQTLPERLDQRLSSGDSVALIGGPAEGKSVSAKQVSHRLFEKNENVLYCSGSSDIESAEQVILDWVDEVEGGVIVIDDADERLEMVYDLAELAETRQNIRILFTVRESAWEQSTPGRGSFSNQVRPSSIESQEIPELSLTDVEAALDRYRKLTGTNLSLSPQSLYSHISRDISQSSLLVLLHLIAAHQERDDIEGSGGRTILHQNASQTANSFDTELEKYLAFTTCILKTSHLPASPEFYHCFGHRGYTHEEVSEAIDSLHGSILFGQQSGYYQTKHEVWCSIFLETCLNSEDRNDAIERFETCINTIFQLAENRELRKSINNWVRREQIPVELDEQGVSAMLTARLFLPGQRYNTLIDYYGETGFSGIELPDTIPEGIELHQHIWRGSMALSRGGSSGGMSDLDWAEKEYTSLLERASEIEEAPEEALLDIDALALTNTAVIKQRRGNIKAAIEDLEKAREIAVQLGDKYSEAVALGNIAANYVYYGDSNAAESYYKRSIQARREIGDYFGWAKDLGGLSVIYFERGDSKRAKACNETAKRVFEEFGDLHNLSLVYSRTASMLYSRGDKDTAKKLQRQSLHVNQQLDDQEKAARDLMGLGSWELREQNLDKAEEYTMRARDILVQAGADREIAKCDGNLANIATARGNFQKALEEQKRVIDVFQEYGDSGSEGRAWADLGNVYLMAEDFSEALDCFTTSYELLMEAGEDRTAFSVMFNIGQIAEQQGSQQIGGHFFKTAMIDLFESGSYYIGLESLDSYLQIHIDRSNPKQSLALALQGWLIAEREEIDEWKAHYLILYHSLLSMGHPDLYALIYTDLLDILESYDCFNPVYIEFAHNLIDGVELPSID